MFYPFWFDKWNEPYFSVFIVILSFDSVIRWSFCYYCYYPLCYSMMGRVKTMIISFFASRSDGALARKKPMLNPILTRHQNMIWWWWRKFQHYFYYLFLLPRLRLTGLTIHLYMLIKIDVEMNWKNAVVYVFINNKFGTTI